MLVDCIVASCECRFLFGCKLQDSLGCLFGWPAGYLWCNKSWNETHAMQKYNRHARHLGTRRDLILEVGYPNTSNACVEHTSGLECTHTCTLHTLRARSHIVHFGENEFISATISFSARNFSPPALYHFFSFKFKMRLRKLIMSCLLCLN